MAHVFHFFRLIVATKSPGFIHDDPPLAPYTLERHQVTMTFLQQRCRGSRWKFTPWLGNRTCPWKDFEDWTCPWDVFENEEVLWSIVTSKIVQKWPSWRRIHIEAFHIMKCVWGPRLNNLSTHRTWGILPLPHVQPHFHRALTFQNTCFWWRS